MMTTASRLAWGIFLVAAAALPGCSSSDDDSNNNAGSGGSAGAGTSGGAGGMACVGDPPIKEHTPSCADIPSANKNADGFTISSPDFENCKPLPTEDTCDGNAFGSGKSPALAWSGAPTGTKSFVLAFKDIALLSDNPNDPHGFHWVMWDIPVSTTGLAGGMTGPGVDFHSPDVTGAVQWSNLGYGFFPPCPNPFPRDNAMFACSLADDIYSFTLYAMPTEKLDDLPAADVDATSGMPTGNYVVKMVQYVEALTGDQAPLAVTEYRATSHAWASSFAPPPGGKYPCTKAMIDGNMTDSCLQ